MLMTEAAKDKICPLARGLQQSGCIATACMLWQVHEQSGEHQTYVWRDGKAIPSRVVEHQVTTGYCRLGSTHHFPE